MQQTEFSKNSQTLVIYRSIEGALTIDCCADCCTCFHKWPGPLAMGPNHTKAQTLFFSVWVHQSQQLEQRLGSCSLSFSGSSFQFSSPRNPRSSTMNLGRLIHLSLLLCPLLSFHFKIARASAHIYPSQPFHDVGNSLLLYGGSEGIYASSRSFIRYRIILFAHSSTAVLCTYPPHWSVGPRAGLRTSLSGGQVLTRDTAMD